MIRIDGLARQKTRANTRTLETRGWASHLTSCSDQRLVPRQRILWTTCHKSCDLLWLFGGIAVEGLIPHDELPVAVDGPRRPIEPPPLRTPLLSQGSARKVYSPGLRNASERSGKIIGGGLREEYRSSPSFRTTKPKPVTYYLVTTVAFRAAPFPPNALIHLVSAECEMR